MKVPFERITLNRARSHLKLCFLKFDSTLRKILATEWDPPKHPNVSGPLRPRLAFCIEILDGGDDASILCASESSAFTQRPDCHACRITLGDEANVSGIALYRVVLRFEDFFELVF